MWELFEKDLIFYPLQGMNPFPVYFIFESFICFIGMKVETPPSSPCNILVIMTKLHLRPTPVWKRITLIITTTKANSVITTMATTTPTSSRNICNLSMLHSFFICRKLSYKKVGNSRNIEENYVGWVSRTLARKKGLRPIFD